MPGLPPMPVNKVEQGLHSSRVADADPTGIVTGANCDDRSAAHSRESLPDLDPAAI